MESLKSNQKKEESKQLIPTTNKAGVQAVALKPEEKQVFHGSKGSVNWKAPKCTLKSTKIARGKDKSYVSKTQTEYKDHPEVLAEKIKVLAKMIKESQLCVAYTGAGISTNAGINDYASANKPKNAITNFRLARPTKAHHVITALINNNHIMHWCQQNHDGLAQKAGCPKDFVNEIHGSWYDKSNPVVKMSGSLKKENFECLNDWVQLQDMVIAVGTSMVGMGSDRIAV